MIHYHGLPIHPMTAAVQAITGGHAFISHRYVDQLGLAVDVCQSFALDNGAYSAWKSGQPVADWSAYYAWVEDVSLCPGFDFAVIPDVIDGDADANDALLREWPLPMGIGAPVYHLHEPLEHLRELVADWPRICIGSSGQYAQVGCRAWWVRMAEAMNVICRTDGRPKRKIHGLRLLDPRIVARFPFASADSTNIAMNIGIDKKWNGGYAPLTKPARAQVLRERIEHQQSPAIWDRESMPVQFDMFSLSEL